MNEKFTTSFFEQLDMLLANHFGEPHKKCEDATDFLVRGILSQNTNDLNRDRAFALLKQTFSHWELLFEASDEEIENCIKVAGMAKTRTQKIRSLLHSLQNSFGALNAAKFLELPAKEAMDKLLAIDGIGMKTAAVFLLFCGNAPYFPVDTHIHRIMIRLGIFDANTLPTKMIIALSATIPHALHYRLHLNIIALGKNICTARRAMCDKCPINTLCDKRLQ